MSHESRSRVSSFRPPLADYQIWSFKKCTRVNLLWHRIPALWTMVRRFPRTKHIYLSKGVSQVTIKSVSQFRGRPHQLLTSRSVNYSVCEVSDVFCSCEGALSSLNRGKSSGSSCVELGDYCLCCINFENFTIFLFFELYESATPNRLNTFNTSEPKVTSSNIFFGLSKTQACTENAPTWFAEEPCPTHLTPSISLELGPCWDLSLSLLSLFAMPDRLWESQSSMAIPWWMPIICKPDNLLGFSHKTPSKPAGVPHPGEI